MGCIYLQRVALVELCAVLASWCPIAPSGLTWLAFPDFVVATPLVQEFFALPSTCNE